MLLPHKRVVSLLAYLQDVPLLSCPVALCQIQRVQHLRNQMSQQHQQKTLQKEVPGWLIPCCICVAMSMPI
jgi:hypothetical protein